MGGMFERYACEFRAPHLVSPLTHSSHGSSLKICCRQRQQSLKDRSLFRSFSSRIVMHGSGSIVIFAKGWLATRLAPPNTSISTRPLYFTLGRAITLDIGIIIQIMKYNLHVSYLSQVILGLLVQIQYRVALTTQVFTAVTQDQRLDLTVIMVIALGLTIIKVIAQRLGAGQ